MVVYSPDRVLRLRLVLLVVVVLGAVTMLFAADMLFADAVDAAGLVAMGAALLLLVSGGTAFLLLQDAGRPAKLAAIVTGVVCVLCGLVLAGSWLALLLPLIGLGLLFLALIPDDPEAAT